MTINELIEKRANLWKAMDAFLKAQTNEKGVLSAEDDAKYAAMEDDFDNLTKEIKRLEKRNAIEAELNMPMNAPIVSKPMESKADIKTGKASKAYNEAFWKQARNSGYLSAEIRNALQEGVDSEGGYLVPDEFEHTLVEALAEDNIFRKNAHTFTTSSGSHKIPVVATKGSASWIDEEGAIPESDDSFGQVSIEAHKVGTLIKVSEELLNDSAFNLEAYFTTEFARRIGEKEEDAFFNGNGTGKPTGIFHTTGGAQVGVTAASATAITADEIIDLFYSLKAPYRKKAIWVLNDTTVKLIRKLKDNTGAYLWQPALTAGTPDTILGRPVYTSQFVPEVATGKKTVAFGDFNFYWIGDRQGITFRRLNEKYADTCQVGFLATKRLDGKLTLPEAIKVLQQKAGSTSGTGGN